MMQNFEEFAKAIAARESSGNYSVKNKLGYLGAYQFGMLRLIDLGFAEYDSAKKPVWRDHYSEAKFLSSPQLQDEAFRRHVDLIKSRILNSWRKDYVGKTIRNITMSLSGMVAAVHLLGFGSRDKERPYGLDTFLLHEVDGTDGFGTHISEYITKFSGYDI